MTTYLNAHHSDRLTLGEGLAVLRAAEAREADAVARGLDDKALEAGIAKLRVMVHRGWTTATRKAKAESQAALRPRATEGGA